MLINNDDLVNFPYEYTDVISLYVAYSMLMKREDSRWQSLKEEHKERRREYI
jgi:hypothetical protein